MAEGSRGTVRSGDAAELADPETKRRQPDAQYNSTTSASVALGSQCQDAYYFPYGNSDFGEIRKRRQFFVDNTAVVPLIAKMKHSLLLRPPRFGKSLLLSAVQHYYDINSKADFPELFGGLAAGQGEDPLRNTFHVLNIDLSLDVDPSADFAQMKTMLLNTVNMAIKTAAASYGLTVEIFPADIRSSLESFVLAVKTVANVQHRRLLVLVDEYDRYANKLMFENSEVYAKLVRGTPSVAASSPIRSFFEALKAITGLDRYHTFTTGIAPIALADASGANHMRNISFDSLFAGALGFTEGDIVRALTDISTDQAQQHHILGLMRTYYNGYQFPRSTITVYNATLCLYFLQQYLVEPDFRSVVHTWSPGSPLNTTMLDSNVKLSDRVVDVAKQMRFMTTLCDELLAGPVLLSENLPSTTIRSHNLLAQTDLVAGQDVEAAQKLARLNVLSFMYYHGMVTFVASLPAASSSTSSSSSSSSSSSTSSSPPALPLLKIPNLVVRENLVEALKGCLTGHYAIVQQMLRDPSIESVRICLETCLRSTVTPMDKFFSESAAQKALETYFVHVLLNTGNFKLWVADGEGYQQGVVRPDLVFLPVDGKSIVHVELKIVRPQHLELACGDRDATIADAALKQLRESIRRESDDTRRRRTIVEQFAGGRQHSVDVLEAETRAKSLNIYVPFLRRKFGDRKIFSFTAIIMGDSVLVSQVEPQI